VAFLNIRPDKTCTQARARALGNQEG